MSAAGGGFALALTLLALLPGRDPLGGGSEGEAIAREREWRVREWALAQARGEVAEGLAAALADSDWQERYAALDALARTPLAARSGLAQHPVASALWDPHPLVRSAALEVYAAAAEPPPIEAHALARDPISGVRLALARALARSEPGPAGRAVLLELALGEGRAASTARRGLLTLGPEASDAQLTLLSGDAEELLEALPLLRRAPIRAELVRGLRERARTPLAQALVEALALHGELDQEGSAAAGFPPADRERLAGGWRMAEPGEHELFGLRELWLEVAREGDATLARALLTRARELLEQEREGALFLAECAAQAVPPEEAIALAGDLPEALAAEVWGAVLPPLRYLDRESTLRWLAPDVDPDLRLQVASLVAEHYLQSGDPSAQALLVDLLEDGDPSLRRGAFHWLAEIPEDGPGGAPPFEILHRSWLRYPPAQRELDLRSLPRDRPPQPFRDDLLALCADPLHRTASLLELLGTFRRDAEVQATLTRWLDEELRGLEKAREGRRWRLHEARAVALVRALAPPATQPIAAALERVLAAPPPLATDQREDPQLSKTCCALLGGDPRGRARLAAYLGEGIERRARIEAAIQILEARDPAAALADAEALLVQDLEGCDPQLGARVLRALGRGSRPGGARLLAQVLGDAGRGLDQRLAALEGLVQREDWARLRSAFEECTDPDLAAVLAGALASSGDPEGIALLQRAWGECERELAAPGADAILEQRLGELTLALMRAEALEPSRAARAILGRAVGRAEKGLEARFRGEKPKDAGPPRRLALEACALAARRGELPLWLESVGPWWRLDGEWLAALERLAEEAPELELAARLAVAAEVAFGGEARTREGDRRRIALQARALRLAARREELAEIRARAAFLWGEVRLATHGRSALEEALGHFDRPSGSDPAAELDAARLQGAARLALAAGERERARALAQRAATRLGASRAAHWEQRSLEAALER